MFQNCPLCNTIHELPTVCANSDCGVEICRFSARCWSCNEINPIATAIEAEIK